MYIYIYTFYQETGSVRDGLYFVKVILSDILIQSGKDDLTSFLMKSQTAKQSSFG